MFETQGRTRNRTRDLPKKGSAFILSSDHRTNDGVFIEHSSESLPTWPPGRGETGCNSSACNSKNLRTLPAIAYIERFTAVAGGMHVCVLAHDATQLCCHQEFELCCM